MSTVGRHGWAKVSSLSPLQVVRAGQSGGVDVWATGGMPLAVGDRVLLLDMGGALVILQPLVSADTYAPPRGLDVVPPAPLSLSWLPTIDQAHMAAVWAGSGDADESMFADSGWWSDAEEGYAYGNLYTDDDVTFYGCGPVAPHNSIEVMLTSELGVLTYGFHLANFAPGLGSDVTAGAAYVASVHTAGTVGTDPAWRLGIEWQDAGGSALSTSWGAVAAGASDGEVWYWGSDPIEADARYTLTAQPTATGTAPPGTARCRLVIEATFDPESGPTWRASHFQLASA